MRIFGAVSTAVSGCLLVALTNAAEPAPRYELQADTARDVRTGLTWQRAASPDTFTWSAAALHCGDLELSGQNDWRVPTMKELQTIVDESHVGPAVDPAVFPDTPALPYWTSSPWAATPNLAWYVHFQHGSGLYELVTKEFRVRCVR